MKAIIFIALLLSVSRCADVAFGGVYVQGTQSGTSCCYPAGNVNVAQGAVGGEVTATWTWANTAACTGLTPSKGNVAVTAKGTPASSSTSTVALQTNAATPQTVGLLIPSGATAGLLTLPDGTGCNVVLVKSSYLFGLGSLVLLSFSYLMF